MVVGDHCAKESLKYKPVTNMKVCKTNFASCVKFNPKHILMVFNVGPQLHLHFLGTNKKKTININDNVDDNSKISSAVFTRFNWDPTGKYLCCGATDGYVRVYNCSNLIASVNNPMDEEDMI